MTELISQEDLIAAVDELSDDQLEAYVASGLIEPIESEDGPLFEPQDANRLTLLCFLQTMFLLDNEALKMVVSLIDQLHMVRTELSATLEMIDNEAPEVRDRMIARLAALQNRDAEDLAL